jgi:hypothetical protein
MTIQTIMLPFYSFKHTKLHNFKECPFTWVAPLIVFENFLQLYCKISIMLHYTKAIFKLLTTTFFLLATYIQKEKQIKSVKIKCFLYF